MRKVFLLLIETICILQSSIAFAYDIPTIDTISSKSLEFAAQYPYKNGDVEKSLSFGIPYTSGFETRNDGVEYECPAIYRDQDAMFANNFDLKKGEMTLLVNDKLSSNSQECILCNSVTLVPIAVFDEIGCSRTYNESLYVTTLKKNNNILEIMPYLIGMRLNQADGYYVPLESCSRYVDGDLYVPLRRVAENLGINVGWNGDKHTVSLTDTLLK